MTQISIVTITQYSRFECLQNLYEIIRRQNYKNILEWIIVEGSQNDDLRNQNIKQIKNFISDKTGLSIRLVVSDKMLPLSNLRNIGNDHCRGDIIVCMDDDDYYQMDYVSYVVNLLNTHSGMIVGCSETYIYDYIHDKLYKFKGFHKNHSTNNCMAYKKEYLKENRYKDGLYMAEEFSFTKGFTEPMIQMKSEKSIIVSSHRYNTVDKQNNTPFVDEIKDKYILDYIPKDIFENMKRILS